MWWCIRLLEVQEEDVVRSSASTFVLGIHVLSRVSIQGEDQEYMRVTLMYSWSDARRHAMHVHKQF